MHDTFATICLPFASKSLKESPFCHRIKYLYVFRSTFPYGPDRRYLDVVRKQTNSNFNSIDWKAPDAGIVCYSYIHRAKNPTVKSLMLHRAPGMRPIINTIVVQIISIRARKKGETFILGHVIWYCGYLDLATIIFIICYWQWRKSLWLSLGRGTIPFDFVCFLLRLWM